MRIGFFTDTYLPKPFGIETSIETFRESLEKENHEVYIFAPYTPGYVDKNHNVFRFLSLNLDEKRGDRLSFPILKNGDTSQIIDFPLDIVHAHTPYTMGFFARFVSNHQNIPFIYTHHSDYQGFFHQYFSEKNVIPYFINSFLTNFANSADTVIAPSLKVAEFLKKNKIKSPILYLPTGVRLDLFERTALSLKAAKKLRQDLGIPEGGKVLLAVGRVEKRKNFTFLLKVFKRIAKENDQRAVFFLLVGDGTFLEDLKKMAKKLGIEKKCIFAGLVPREKMPFYFQASDIYLVSSLIEAQGISVLEAAASGLPIVALENNAFLDIIVENKNGFSVPQKKINVFARGVQGILDNQDLSRRLSEGSLNIAKDFSGERQAEKLVDLYKIALQRRSGKKD